LKSCTPSSFTLAWTATVSDVNRFVWPGPDLRPIFWSGPERFDYGLLPMLFRRIRDHLLACAKAQRLAIMQRTE
jgi:hypothetical protein